MSKLNVDTIEPEGASTTLTLGASGDTVDLSNTTVTLPDSTYLANKNVAINGAMQISQRGTSESSVTTAQYADAPDRWYIQLNGAGTWTVSQSTTAPNGFSHSYKFDCTTADASLAASDRLYLAQKIEGQNLQRFAKGTADAKKYTVSFWARSSKTGTYIVGLWDADNSRQCSQSYSIGSADTWTKIEVEFPADTTGGITYDNSQGMQLIFYLAAGTDYSSGSLSTTWEASDATKRAVGQVNVADSTSGDWYITGIQFEVGDTATPFEYKTFEQELAACQRYYERAETKGAGQGFDVWVNTTTQALGRWVFQVEKRTAPTFSVINAAADYAIFTAGTTNAVTALSAVGATTHNILLNASTGGGLTAGQAGDMRDDGNSLSGVQADAEL